jgi:hypothetical protein
MFDVSKFEAALAANKEEIDVLSGKLAAVRNSAKELKPSVLKYTDLKHEEKGIHKLINLKQREFNIKKGFFESAGGNTDGIYPLFRTESEENNNFVQLNTAETV